MMSDHREIMNENRVRLVESLANLMNTPFPDCLVEKKVISQEQLKSIKDRNSTNIREASDLLDHMYAKTYDVWITFLDCASTYDCGSIIRDLLVEHQLKRLQRPVCEALLSHYNTTEIWVGGDNFTPFDLDQVFVEPVFTMGRRDAAACAEDVKMEEYTDIIEKLSDSKTVFVFGEPGTGKSTLSKKLCCDWAKLQCEDAMDIENTMSQNFSFILPISFLEIKENQTFQQYVSDTYGIKRYAEKLFKYIKDHQESVLLVCDEIEHYKEETSVEMTQLLHRRLFPEVKMLVMSRSPSLPAFCNDSYWPIKTLSLQGFSDDGVKQYVRKLYSTEADRLLPHLENLEYGRYVTRNPAFLPMLLRITLKEIQNITTVDVTEYCKEYVSYTIRRAQRKRKGLITAEKTIDQILNEHQTFIKVLGQLAKGNVKPEKMETIFFQQQVQRYKQQSGDMMFEFLIEHKGENGGTVYMFTQKILQEFFLSYFLVGSKFSDLEDILLEFCGCRDAFVGTRVVEIIEGLQFQYLEKAMRTIYDGDEREMAKLHTHLQLQYVKKYEDAMLVLPEVMYMSTGGYRPAWGRYLAMDGSNLVKLTVETDQFILNSLQLLNAPNLSSFTLLLKKPCSAENEQQIERSLSRFSLKSLEIQRLIGFNRYTTVYVAVTAACNLSRVEELRLIRVRLASDHTEQLKQRLKESVLKVLTISECDLEREQLFGLVVAVSTSPSLNSLDISANCIYADVGGLVHMTENFKKLQKLNLTGYLFSKEENQEIKEKLQIYQQLELRI